MVCYVKNIVYDFTIQLLRSYHVKKATIFLKAPYSFLCWKILKLGELLVQDVHLILL